MASPHDDGEVEIKKEISMEERLDARQREAEANGDVLVVGSDSDDAAPPTKRVKTEPKAVKVAVSSSGGSPKKPSSVGLAPGQPPSM